MRYIVRYDHDEDTETEISIEANGVKTRYETLWEAAKALPFTSSGDLLDMLEANNGEIVIELN